MPINSGGVDNKIIVGLTWIERINIDNELNEEPTDTTSEGCSWVTETT